MAKLFAIPIRPAGPSSSAPIQRALEPVELQCYSFMHFPASYIYYFPYAYTHGVARRDNYGNCTVWPSASRWRLLVCHPPTAAHPLTLTLNAVSHPVPPSLLLTLTNTLTVTRELTNFYWFSSSVCSGNFIIQEDQGPALVHWHPPSFVAIDYQLNVAGP